MSTAPALLLPHVDTPRTDAGAAAGRDTPIDWSPTTAQLVGAAVGLAIGGSTVVSDELSVGAKVVFVAAYTVACGVIPRLRGVVRHRRVGQFSAHQAAMAAIAGGWLVEGQPGPAAFNALWFVSAGAWWLRSRASD